jgi:hypothetical protein
MLSTFGYVCDKLETDYIKNSFAPSIFKNAAKVALEKLAPYYGKTDRIPIYIVASSMCIDDI